MPAEIEWNSGAKRSGIIRFGPEFRSAHNRDPWSGVMSIKDHGDWCDLFAVAGKITRQDVDDVLAACADAGFAEAYEERNGKRWAYDLTERPYKRRRV